MKNIYLSLMAVVITAMGFAQGSITPCPIPGSMVTGLSPDGYYAAGNVQFSGPPFIWYDTTFYYDLDVMGIVLGVSDDGWVAGYFDSEEMTDTSVADFMNQQFAAIWNPDTLIYLPVDSSNGFTTDQIVSSARAINGNSVYGSYTDSLGNLNTTVWDISDLNNITYTIVNSSTSTYGQITAVNNTNTLATGWIRDEIMGDWTVAYVENDALVPAITTSNPDWLGSDYVFGESWASSNDGNEVYFNGYDLNNQLMPAMAQSWNKVTGETKLLPGLPQIDQNGAILFETPSTYIWDADGHGTKVGSLRKAIWDGGGLLDRNAAIWDANDSAYHLQTLLLQRGITDVQDYLLTDCNSISNDGQVIMVWAIDADGVWTTVKVELESILSVEETVENTVGTFNIYPQPATDVINIQLAGSEVYTRAYITDITGKVVNTLSVSNFNLGNTTVEVSVANLQAGPYIMVLESENGISTQKLIKQ